MLARKLMIPLLASVSLSCCACRNSGFDLPNIMLWAWQRPEDLSFIDSKTTGVAVLAGTAAIAPDGSVRFRPRMERLALNPQTAVLAVVRIEAPTSHGPVQTEPLLAGLKQAENMPGVRGLQIDFDARASERPLYRTLLASLKGKIGVTALASWCEGDSWLDGEPVIEAVPMFFRMGENANRNMEVSSPVCRSSIGLSTDEPWPLHRTTPAKRIYLFNPRPWTREVYSRALRQLDQWK